MGTWKKLVRKYEPLFNRTFFDKEGMRWSFFGLVLCSDDYYYGLYSDKEEYKLYSCVGNLEDMGFTLAEPQEFPGLSITEEALYNELRIKVISKITDEEYKMFNKLLNKIIKYKSILEEKDE